MKKTIGYCRVSTSQQVDTGASLEAQEEKIKAMAVVQDTELMEIIVDAGESAKSLNRPGMERLLSLIDAGKVERVIVAKLDRLTRSVRDLGDILEHFQRRGVSLVSVAETLDTGTAAGRLVLNIMASVSQWEREAIGERTREVLQHKKAKGERVGTIPFGFRLTDDGIHISENQREQRILTLIHSLRKSGFSLREIAAELNSQGFQTRCGSEWRFEYVRSIINQVA